MDWQQEKNGKGDGWKSVKIGVKLL